MSHRVELRFITVFSGQHIGPIFKSQAVFLPTTYNVTPTPFTGCIDNGSSSLPVWWRHRTSYGWPFTLSSGKLISQVGHSSPHISGLDKLATFLTPLPTTSPVRLSTSVSTRSAGVFVKVTNPTGAQERSSFHIYRLDNLATLPPPSPLRLSTGVSGTIGDAFVKLTNLMAAQSVPQRQYRTTILTFVTSPKESGTQLHGVISLKSRKTFVFHWRRSAKSPTASTPLSPPQKRNLLYFKTEWRTWKADVYLQPEHFCTSKSAH